VEWPGIDIHSKEVDHQMRASCSTPITAKVKSLETFED
jgi:hypothetical protein